MIPSTALCMLSGPTIQMSWLPHRAVNKYSDGNLVRTGFLFEDKKRQEIATKALKKTMKERASPSKTGEMNTVVRDTISHMKDSVEYFFTNINTEEETTINNGSFLSEPAGVDIILNAQ